MAQRKETSPTHSWVGASLHPLDPRDAAYSNRYGEHETMGGDRMQILQVYCEQCRRSYDDVVDIVCEAASGFDHLVGGPTGRRKRAHDHDCAQHGCGGTMTPERAAELRRLAADPAPRRRAL